MAGRPDHPQYLFSLSNNFNQVLKFGFSLSTFNKDAGDPGPGQVLQKLPQDVGSTRLVAGVSKPRKLTESNDEAGKEEEKEEDAGGFGPKEGNNNCSSLLSWKNETLYPPTKRRKISNPSPVWRFQER